MKNRQSFQTATSSLSLGILADDVVFATLRYLNGDNLSAPDRETLNDLRSQVDALLSVGSTSPPGEALGRMAAIASLEETYQAFTTASLDEDTIAFFQQLVGAIDSLLSGPDHQKSASFVRDFAERLANIMLTRAEELSHQSHPKSFEWTRLQSSS